MSWRLCVLFLIIGQATSSLRYLQCPLQWVETTLGELPVHSVPVSTFNIENYVARGLVGTNLMAAGRVEKTSGNGYFPHNGQSVQLIEYEVLTNPYDCVLEWIQEANATFGVKTENSFNGYVGRASSGEKGILSGEVRSGEIFFIDQEEKFQKFDSGDFEWLISYSRGLNLEIRNFEFIDDNTAETELISTDEIHNNSPAEARQTLIHRTSVTESTSFTSTTSWGRTYSVDIGVSYGAIDLKLGYQNSKENEDSETISEEKQREISITRELVVPPYSSVQACTTLTTMEMFDMRYNAEDRYTAPGFTGLQINAILKEDNINNGMVKDDAVIVNRSGSLTGNLAAHTRFLVIPFEMGTEGGCVSLQEKLTRLRKAKKMKSLVDVASLEMEINKIISSHAK